MSTMMRSDLDAVRDLLAPMTSVAAVYLGLAPAEPNADAREDRQLRWRLMAGRLRAEGADEPTVAAIGHYVSTLPVYPTELVLFAAGGELLMVQPIPGGAAQDRAAFAAPTQAGPLLAWLRRHPPHVVVVTDRTGADLVTVPGGAMTGSGRTVLGPDDEIERNAPGGWSQPRYQRRAEDSWQHNAAAVAEAVAAELHRVGAELVLVAGDVRATQLLRDRLARLEHHAVIRPLPGGRSEDGSAAHRQAGIRRELNAYAAERSAAELDRFATASGRGGTAVRGAKRTLAALAAGQVQTLLVVDDPADRRAAWFGEHVWAASSPGDQAGLEHALRRGRMVDVATRAALLTRAKVVVLPSGEAPRLAEGIGAVRRYR